ncbi:MAG TPA: hypothetical protein VFG47_21840, partial [Geminicoccaceae bacterium]|nr:hypothetical protein [Geminicoccaceae bacterium]
MRRPVPRLLRALAVAGLAAWWTGPAPSPAAAADRVRVRAHAHADFGRLAFEWPARVGVTAAVPDTDRLTLRFTEPFEGDLAAAVDRLRGYVRKAARDAAEVNEVLLRLQPDTRHKLSTIGDRIVVVDLFRGGGVPESPTVRVRTGRHAGYGRIVFDLPFAPDYRVEREGERATVRFGRPVRIDVAGIPRDLAPLVPEARTESDAEASRVILRVPPGAKLRDFALPGNRVVVDVFEPAAEASRVADHPAVGVRAPAAPPPPPPAAPTAVTPEVDPPPARPATVAGSGSPAPAAAPPPALAVSSAAVDGGVELRFDWSPPVAAAVFLRAGHLWTVFAGDPAAGGGRLALPPLDAALGDVLGPGEVVDAEGGLALRFPLRREVQPGVTREGGRWRVALRGTAPPPRSLEPRRRSDPARLFFPGAGTVVRLADPEVGDRLHVLPFLEGGLGQPAPRRFVDLRLLATAQGIVWQALADGLRARPVEGGVELGTPDGLRLTILPELNRQAERADAAAPDGRTGAARPAATAEPTPGAEPATAAVEAAGPDPPFGLAAAAPPELHRWALLRRVLAAPPERRDAARLDLARFLLARALAAESLAVLGAVGVAAADGPAAAAPTALARDSLTGAAQLLMGRLPEAQAGLAANALDGDPEAALWRAVLAAVENDWPRAARELERSGSTLAGYPPPLRVRLGLTAALVALEAGRPEKAFAVIDGLRGLDLDPGDRARLRFTEGLALARDGAMTAAEEAWREVAVAGPPETRQKALYAHTALLLQTGKIDAGEALTRLTAARPFWRGHPWEVTMLDGLARVYAQRGDYHRALGTWKEAITRRPEAPEAATIAEAMGELFVAALTAEGDGAPPAFDALKIYRDFPELSPGGDAGDRLTRRLVERLARFDLVDDAADLLDRQVRYRLRGVDRAEAGAYLGELRLREAAPEAALEALRASATVAELPAELGQRRRLIEARALAMAGRGDEALAALAGDTGRPAEHARAMVHWGRRDWPRVIEVAERLLLPGRVAPGDAPLGPEARDLVLRLA